MVKDFHDAARRNRLLAALSVHEYARLQDDLEFVSLKLGEVLYEKGGPINYVYFPVTCIVSMVATTENGGTAELSLIGNDGLVGIPLVLGGTLATHHSVVQSGGSACRLKAAIMRWELDQGGELLQLALRYTQSQMTQMAQSVVCNRHHSVDQQLCRWLLLSFDRLPGNQLEMTQALIANMLGVRREAVTEAAGKLQAAGLIRYRRGRIELKDRPALEARVCECYATVRNEDERLFKQLPHTRPTPARPRPNPATLRQRAEARLRRLPPAPAETDWESRRRLHELEVHQIELEMHNEELQRIYDETDHLHQRYLELYDYSPVSYFTLDAQGTIKELNLAGAILLNIERQQKGRHHFSRYVIAEQRQAFRQFMADVLVADHKQLQECVLAANDQRANASIVIEALPGADGQECRMVVIDVTTQREAEKALRIREQYLRATIDNIPFLVWLKDDKSRFLAVNMPFAQNFGFPSADSLVGKDDFDIARRSLARAYRADDAKVLASGQPQMVEERIDSDGQARWFETFKSPVTMDGKTIGTVGFARDITERLRIRAALEESEARHRGFIENLPLGVAITQDGIIRYLNPAALSLVEYTTEECVGQSFLPFIHEDDRQMASDHHTHRLRGQSAPPDYEVRLIAKGGEVIHCHTHVRTIQFDGRNAALSIFEDIRPRKQLEAELRSLAATDPLTGMPNRRQFFTRLEEALSRLKRGVDNLVAVMMIDLDHFKQVNDKHGHAVGDSVLRHVTGLLRAELRKVDLAGRIGGEEFAVLMPEADRAEAAIFAERLRRRIAESPLIIAGQALITTISIGIAEMDIADQRADDSLLRADKAMYLAKVRGRNRVEIATEDTQLPASIHSASSPD